MNLFSKETAKTLTQLVINITSRGVSGGLVYENEVGQHVIWHQRVGFKGLLEKDQKHRRQILRQALEVFLREFNQVGRRRLLAFKNRATLEQVAVFFSSPWQLEDTITTNDAQQTHLPITQQRLETLREEAHQIFRRDQHPERDSRHFVDLHERVVGAYSDDRPVTLPYDDYTKKATLTFHLGKVPQDIFNTVKREVSTHFAPGMTTIHSFNDVILDQLRDRAQSHRQFFVRVHDHQVDVYVIRGGRVVSSATAPVGESFLREGLAAAGLETGSGADTHLRLGNKRKHSKREKQRLDIATEEVQQVFSELLSSAVKNAQDGGGMTHVHVLSSDSPAGEMFREFAHTAAKNGDFTVHSLNDEAARLSGLGRGGQSLDPELALGILGYKFVNQ